MQDFQQIQQDWGQWLRAETPAAPLAGIAPERAQLYRELIRTNLFQLYSSCFPVCRSLPNLDWPALLSRFIAEHRAQTPLFHHAAAELVAYLLAEPPLAVPYLAELAHYEWLELDLSLAADPPVLDTPLAQLPEPDDWSSWQLEPSPVSRFQGYRYPVQRIGRDWQPTQLPAQPSWLLLHRHPDYQIRFIELSQALGLLLNQPGPNLAVRLDHLAQAAGREPDALMTGAWSGLNDLYQHGMLRLIPLQL